jgi:transcriptional regulator with XRE-family HTH domain
MDVAGLMRAARLQAQLSKTALADLAGTSTAALLEYESGRRSPTVATFARILAACGTQVRGELEPLHAHTDEVVDDLIARSSGGLGRSAFHVTTAFEASSARWALDGRSAMAAHGLGEHPRLAVELVTVDSTDLRQLLDTAMAQPRSRDGWPVYTDWHDIDLADLAYAPMCTRYGFLTMRLVEELPSLLRITVPLERDAEGDEVPDPTEISLPVLALLDVEAAHPSLATVLARLREHQASTRPAPGQHQDETESQATA